MLCPSALFTFFDFLGFAMSVLPQAPHMTTPCLYFAMHALSHLTSPWYSDSIQELWKRKRIFLLSADAHQTFILLLDPHARSHLFGATPSLLGSSVVLSMLFRVKCGRIHFRPVFLWGFSCVALSSPVLSALVSMAMGQLKLENSRRICG